jgi:hypothetical protein
MHPTALIAIPLLAVVQAACASSPRDPDSWTPRTVDGDAGGTPWTQPRAYAGVGLGFVQGGLPRVDNGGTDLVKGGYRIDPRWSAELSVERSEGDLYFDGSIPVSVWTLTEVAVEGKYHFLEGRFQPHLLAGVGTYDFRYESDDGRGKSSRGAFGRVGAGFEWNFANDWALFSQAAWDQPFGSRAELNHVSVQLGILVRF